MNKSSFAFSSESHFKKFPEKVSSWPFKDDLLSASVQTASEAPLEGVLLLPGDALPYQLLHPWLSQISWRGDAFLLLWQLLLCHLLLCSLSLRYRRNGVEWCSGELDIENWRAWVEGFLFQISKSQARNWYSHKFLGCSVLFAEVEAFIQFILTYGQISSELEIDTTASPFIHGLFALGMTRLLMMLTLAVFGNRKLKQVTVSKGYHREIFGSSITFFADFTIIQLYAYTALLYNFSLPLVLFISVVSYVYYKYARVWVSQFTFVFHSLTLKLDILQGHVLGCFYFVVDDDTPKSNVHKQDNLFVDLSINKNQENQILKSWRILSSISWILFLFSPALDYLNSSEVRGSAPVDKNSAFCCHFISLVLSLLTFQPELSSVILATRTLGLSIKEQRTPTELRLDQCNFE